MNTNILITGTSTGVGFESSILFAQKGFKVYASMRNLDKAEALKMKIREDNLDIQILQLDVTDQDSIDQAVETILEQDGKIDYLLNNAGAGYARTLEDVSEDQIQWVTDVNYLGTVRCTKAVLPHMRKQKSGHIINITSVGGLVGQPFNELYCGAKFAVEGFTESLASYVGEAFNIHFTLIEPGGIVTEFMNSTITQTMIDGELASGEYMMLFDRYRASAQKRMEERDFPLYQTAYEVASIIFDITEIDTPPLRIRTSEWSNQFCELKTQADPTGLELLYQVRKNFL